MIIALSSLVGVAHAQRRPVKNLPPEEKAEKVSEKMKKRTKPY